MTRLELRRREQLGVLTQAFADGELDLPRRSVATLVRTGLAAGGELQRKRIFSRSVKKVEDLGFQFVEYKPSILENGLHGAVDSVAGPPLRLEDDNCVGEVAQIAVPASGRKAGCVLLQAQHLGIPTSLPPTLPSPFWCVARICRASLYREAQPRCLATIETVSMK